MNIKVFKYFALIVLIFASVRGAFVYHLGWSPNLIYSISSALLILLGLLSFKYINLKYNFDILFAFRRACLINYIVLSIYSLFYILFVGFSEISTIYIFMIFPIVFLLIRFKMRDLYFAIYLVSIFIFLGTYIFYQIGVSSGFDGIEAANLTLRPGDLIYSRIGENYLPGGYLGSQHDNANVLIMLSAFYFYLTYTVKSRLRIISLIFFALSFSLTILTGSASNILSLGIIVFLILVLKSKKSLLLLIPITIYFYPLIEDNLYFIQKITQDQSELESGGIFNSLDLMSVVKSLHAIFIGGGYYFNVPMMKSEVAFIKILIGFGMLPFIILLFILFSPVYYICTFIVTSKKIVKLNYSKNNLEKVILFRVEGINQLLFSSLPVLTGAFSLIHYGSLFRITSIGLFCIFLAIFYKNYIKIKCKFDVIVDELDH
jgi:hypothetical protein